VIGEREARAIADELLARRQACEDDIQCNAERLLIAMEVFEQRAGRTGGTEFARLEDLLADQAAPPLEEELAALPEPELPVAPEPQAELPVVTDEPARDIPLAAQAPLPLDVIPIPPSREVAAAEPVATPEPEAEPSEVAAAEPAPSAEPDLSEAVEGAELASSDGAATGADEQAPFDTPLSWAFMDLERTERAEIQERLAAAGFYEGEAQGSWTNATLAALQSFIEEEGSGSFDETTQSGAALLLDYVRSDAFASAFGTGGSSLEAAAVPPAPVAEGDALDTTEW
jgi:hypothetical protein